MNIGDTIKDIEDGDCYYQGVVVELNPIRYKIEKVVWNGIEETELNGTISELMWWHSEIVPNELKP